MLIIFDKPGQLCNRLWSFSPFIAYAINNNVDLRILYFQEYLHLFNDTKPIRNTIFSKHGKLLGIILKALPTILQHTPTCLLKMFKVRFIAPSALCATLKDDPRLKKHIYFLASWHAEKPKLTNNDRKSLAYIFSPKPAEKKEIDNLSAQFKEKFTHVIGVHIRRGDYKHYLDGKYYFSDQHYKAQMKSISEQLDGTKCFILCSTDKINVSNFEGLVVTQPNKSAIKDLYILSQCDYIIGPPSSFSMWASFTGQAKLKFMMNHSEKLNIADFSPIQQQNIFANGSKY